MTFPLYFKVCDLHQGKTYVFRVRAVNASGVGTPSDTSEPVLVEARPGELSPETGRRAPCVTGVCGWRGKGLSGWCPVRLLKELDGQMKRSRYSRPWGSARPGRRGHLKSVWSIGPALGAQAAYRGGGGLDHC